MIRVSCHKSKSCEWQVSELFYSSIRPLEWTYTGSRLSPPFQCLWLHVIRDQKLAFHNLSCTLTTTLMGLAIWNCRLRYLPRLKFMWRIKIFWTARYSIFSFGSFYQTDCLHLLRILITDWHSQAGRWGISNFANEAGWCLIRGDQTHKHWCSSAASKVSSYESATVPLLRNWQKSTRDM